MREESVIGLNLNGYSLAALAIIVVGVLALIALLRQNKSVGISRYGFFVERKRFEDLEEDTRQLWPDREGER